MPRAAGWVAAEVAATGADRALAFVGVEVAFAGVGGRAAVGFVGAEVAFVAPAAPPSARRPPPAVIA